MKKNIGFLGNDKIACLCFGEEKEGGKKNESGNWIENPRGKKEKGA